MRPIPTIFEDLSWNAPDNVQAAARLELASIISGRLSCLILNPWGKKIWANCAIILRDMGQPAIDPYLPQILDWLQDANWPGFNTIFELVVTIDHPIMDDLIQLAIHRALSEEEDGWFETLQELTRRRSQRTGL